MITDSKSPSVQNYEESLLKDDIPLQDNAAMEIIITRLNSGRDQRTQPRREFDDMTYEQDYAMNQLAGHSYLRRKRNDDEVRVNTGTAEKKVELIANELLAMNFQPEIKAFDEDDLEVRDLGDDIADMVKRTNEIERDEDLYMEAYLELLTQRAVFIEEDYAELPTVAVRTGRTGKFRKDKHAQKRVLSGLQIFLGDITIPAYRFQEQPWVVKYDRMMYEEAAEIFGEMDKWKYVRAGMPTNDSYGMWFKYRLGVLQNREVEIITYMSTADDEYQVIINGVMMYEPGTELPWEHGGYNMAMIVVKPVSRFFAYGKQPIASAKTLQALADETIRNLVRKMRQAIEPPLGVASGKVYGKDIWSPGAVTQGLPQGAFSPLITHDGVTASEFQMFQLIQEKIDEFVGSYGVQDTPGAGQVTATQIVEQQKQSMKMLGFAVLACIRMKREMTYLRINTIFEKYLDPIGKTPDVVTGKLKDKFRSFSIEPAQLGDGKTGKKVIALSGEPPTPEMQQAMFQAEKTSDKNGQSVRFHVLHVDMLKDFPLSWYVNVNPQERQSGALDRVLFSDKLNQAAAVAQMTGRQMSSDRVLDSFEHTWKSKGWFERDPGSLPQAGGSVQTQGQSLLTALKGMGTAPTGQPNQPVPPSAMTPPAPVLAQAA